MLAEVLADPLRRPRRAGRDYVLAPVAMPGAFHPKVFALLAERRPMLAIGSHNATEAGFVRNREATVCWGYDGTGVPGNVMTDAVELAAQWLRSSPGFDSAIAEDVVARLRRLCPAPGATDPESKILGWWPGERSLIPRFGEFLRGEVRRVVALGPFFDGELRFLSEIVRLWSPDELVVGLQPDAASLGALGADISGLAFADAAALLPAGETDRRNVPYLHAKTSRSRQRKANGSRSAAPIRAHRPGCKTHPATPRRSWRSRALPRRRRRNGSVSSG